MVPAIRSLVSVTAGRTVLDSSVMPALRTHMSVQRLSVCSVIATVQEVGTSNARMSLAIACATLA